MKRPFPALFLLLVPFLLAGCAPGAPSAGPSPGPSPALSSSPSPSPSAGAPLSLEDYYPFKENVTLWYEGQGNEYASYSVHTDYTAGDRVQLRVDNGGTVMGRVLERKDGKLSLVYSREDCYYRENLTGKTGETPEVLLMEPLKKGTEWTLSDGRKRYISAENVTVDTPAGNFNTIEVTTEGDGYRLLDYHAPEVGLVKTIYSMSDAEVTSTLSKVETDKPFTQTVTFYYPNINDDKLYYVGKPLSFFTNDVTRTALADAMKEAPSGSLGKVLSENAGLKSLYLGQDGMVYADFSKELVTEMNAGSGYEAMLLQCITNTLGGYYGTDKVYITVEGEPYSSGHIYMNPGQPFVVDLTSSVELK